MSRAPDLDGDVRERVLREIERLARSGTQIVMAVHDAEDIVPAVRNVLQIEARQQTGALGLSYSYALRPGLPPRRR